MGGGTSPPAPTTRTRALTSKVSPGAFPAALLRGMAAKLVITSGKKRGRHPPVLSMLRLMALEWEQIIVDSADPVALGRWWAEALGWVVVDESEEIIEIRPEPDRMPGLLFVPVPEGKTSKNRLHPDFRPDDQEAEVTRLLSLGARRADTVQDEQHWVTLLDPEGNEFCVLSERKS